MGMTITFAIMGVFMLAAALLMKKRVATSMKNEIETTGTLVGFYI